MYIALIRTILLYILIIFGLRIMGKRQLGQLQPSEFVITILVSNIATLPIEDTNIPLIQGAVPILTLVCSEVIVSALGLRFKKIRKVISGSPRVLIHNGIIDQKEMKSLRFSIDDLMEQLRTNNIFDIKDVAFAIVETTGNLSVYQNFDARNVTPKMLNLPANGDDNTPPVVLISDGTLIEEALRYCNVKREWVEKILRENGYSELKEVFLMTCNKKAEYLLVRKENKKEERKH